MNDLIPPEADNVPPPVAGKPVQRSLFGEILYWLLVPLLIIWPLSIIVTCLIAHHMSVSESEHALLEHARILAAQSEYSSVAVDQIVALPAPYDTLAYVALWDTANDQWMSGERELKQPRGQRPGTLFSVTLRDRPMRATAVELAAHDDLPPRLLLVAQPLDRSDDLSDAIMLRVILPQSLFLPLTLIVIWLALHTGLKPLSNLQERIRARRSDDLSPIDAATVPEDVVPLVHAFNELLTRLSRSVKTQKQFVADAAHQLKTPLAGMRAQAELAQRTDNIEEIRYSLAQLARSSESAAHLVNQLLALARAEAPANITSSLSMINLQELAARTAAEWLPAAQARQIDLGFELRHLLTADGTRMMTPGLFILGDAALLRELLGNLIDNAIRYIPSGGLVTVAMNWKIDPLTGATMPVWQVEDNGPGIPADERLKVFQRFYRIIGSRTAGSGLGLAIVREIAQRHQASVIITEPATGTGCVIEVNFLQKVIQETADFL